MQPYVTFNKAGTYVFRATVTDFWGLSAFRDVNVVVNQKVTSATVTPWNEVAVMEGGTYQFSATAFDQFGDELATQPDFEWYLGWGDGGTIDIDTGVFTAKNGVDLYGGPHYSCNEVTDRVYAVPEGNENGWDPCGEANVCVKHGENIPLLAGSNTLETYTSPHGWTTRIELVDLSDYHNITAIDVTGWDGYGWRELLWNFDNFSFDTPSGHVTIDFDQLPLGTTVTNQYLNATFDGGFVVSGEPFDQSNHTYSASYPTLHLDFAVPVDHLQFTAVDVYADPLVQYGQVTVHLAQQTLLDLRVADARTDDNVVAAIYHGWDRDLYVPEDEGSAEVYFDVRFDTYTLDDAKNIRLKIKRNDGRIIANDDFGDPVLLTRSLPVTDTARDFVFTAWNDEDGNGQLDAGEDRRVVNVHVVEPWTRDGEWTATQAFVLAGHKGASLEDLAETITGYRADAAELCVIGPVTRGMQVDVTPLIEKLEERLRDNAAEAAGSSKAAKFGNDGASPGGLPSRSMGQLAVNCVFEGTPAQPLPRYSCSGMAQIILARGVILTLEAGRDPGDYLYEFDEMDLTLGSVSFLAHMDGRLFLSSQYFTVYDPARPRSTLKKGDWVRFWNAEDYADRHRSEGPGLWWNAESTIMVGPDSYMGWPFETPHSYVEWKQLLIDAYNAKLWWWQHKNVADIQGYDDPSADLNRYPVYAGFINVPKLAQKIFDHRAENGQ